MWTELPLLHYILLGHNPLKWHVDATHIRMCFIEITFMRWCFCVQESEVKQFYNVEVSYILTHIAKIY
jgi:hypothetical protein